jgi:hypothetical protein
MLSRSKKFKKVQLNSIITNSSGQAIFVGKTEKHEIFEKKFSHFFAKTKKFSNSNNEIFEKVKV